MSDPELECQNHANCGDYCNTPREREMVLCEGCLDSYDMQQSDQEELCTLRTQVAELRAENGNIRLEAGGMGMTIDEQRIELETARGLLREVLAYDKAQRIGDGFNLSGLLARIEAALNGTPAPEVQVQQLRNKP